MGEWAAVAGAAALMQRSGRAAWPSLERETLFGKARANDDRATSAVVIWRIFGPAYSDEPAAMKRHRCARPRTGPISALPKLYSDLGRFRNEFLISIRCPRTVLFH